MKLQLCFMVVKLIAAWSEVGIRVEFAPAYELVISLVGYTEKQVHRTFDLGTDWIKRVQQTLSPNLFKRLETAKSRRLMKGFPGAAVIERCPCDKSASGFVSWMGAMTRGEVYDYLTDGRVLKSFDDTSRIIDTWSEVAELLGEWNDEYFRNVPGEILRALADDAVQKRSMAMDMPADELIQQVSVGSRLEPDPDLHQVVLIPQYHLRPWNVTHWTGDTWYDQYPLECDASGHDVTWTRLLRMSRALADESRLRMLQKLAEGPVRFTDLVEASDVTKSTVYHHLVTLRAARLVMLHTDVEQQHQTYALNPDLVEDAKSLLEQLLGFAGRRAP